MHRHVKQQHSNNPLRFPCTICGKVLTRRHSLRVHIETVHTDLQPCFCCWYCNATFTKKTERQVHVRNVRGRICRAQEVNLYLHLQHLSEEEEFRTNGYLWNQDPFNAVSITFARVVKHRYILTSL